MKLILFSLLLIAMPAYLLVVFGVDTYVIPIAEYLFSPLSLAGYIMLPVSLVYTFLKRVKDKTGKLTTSELLFFSLVLLSAISIVPSAFWIYNEHPKVAIMILGSTFIIIAFIFLILFEKNPKVQVGP